MMMMMVNVDDDDDDDSSFYEENYISCTKKLTLNVIKNIKNSKARIN